MLLVSGWQRRVGVINLIFAAGTRGAEQAIVEHVTVGRVKHPASVKVKREYVDVVSAFDIETSRVPDTEESIMYVWQWAFESDVIVGRTWEQFRDCVAVVKAAMPEKTWLVVFVHNLSYEFQFLSGVFNFGPDDVFAMQPRKVAKADMCGFLEFRCSYIHSNLSLDAFLKEMRVDHKKLHDFDYSIFRLPDTPLTESEIAYAVHDVLGLAEAIRAEMRHDGDTLHTLPLTSTGYVRRDVKTALRNAGKSYHYLAPSWEDYILLREAFRGGNTHANRFYTNLILTDVNSCDRSSSYPDVICNREFPMSPFCESLTSDEKTLRKLMDKHHRACLFRARFVNVELKDVLTGCPYLAHSKCRSVTGSIKDNGRILRAATLETTLTDVDFRIVERQYGWEKIEIFDLRYAQYKKLPQPIIDCCLDYYRKKTELKNIDGQEVLYAKSKRKLNAIYGMMATDPVRAEWKYCPQSDRQFVLSDARPEDQLLRANKSAFLSYAWGVWVTAWARDALQRGIDLVGNQFVYCDTDCVKYVGDIDFSAFNARCIADDMESGAHATDPSGVEHFMGVFEGEETAAQFVTMGAKKYAAIGQKGDLEITVAGVPKKAGSLELESKGGLTAFREGFVFSDCGKLAAVHNDHIGGDWDFVTENGRTWRVTKNTCLVPTTYELGLAGDYSLILGNPHFAIDIVRTLHYTKLAGKKRKSRK